MVVRFVHVSGATPSQVPVCRHQKSFPMAACFPTGSHGGESPVQSLWLFVPCVFWIISLFCFNSSVWCPPNFNAESGLLFQHDYTADIISKHAKAANVILKYDERDCLLFPSLRRVTPRTRKGHPLTRPVLIEIKVHDIKLINTSNANAST